MNILQELQQWYLSNCNGDWEHSFGVTIDTLDNPGWRVSIDLWRTKLAGQPFTEVQHLGHATNWIQCRVNGSKFEGYGGPLMLEEILRVFLGWAAEVRTG